MKTLFVLALSLFSLTGAHAQVQRSFNHSQDSVSSTPSKNNRKEMMEALNLTRDQKIRLKELRQEMNEKKETINNDNSLTDDQKRMAMRQLRLTQRDSLNYILTPDQREKLKDEVMNHEKQVQ